MKPSYLFAAFFTILMIACKKETKDIIADQPVSVDAGTCYGNTWTAGGDFTAGLTYLRLVYNNKLYVFRSDAGGVPEGVHIFDGNTWQSIPCDVPISSNHPSAFGFTIGNKGYIGMSRGPLGSFYEYDFAANTFTPKTLYPATQDVWNTATFVVGNKGYVIGGRYMQSGTIYNISSTYEYNPAANSWSQKADFGWLGMSYCTGFTIGNKGYLINGKFTLFSGDIYAALFREYDPVTDTWTSKAPFPGNPRVSTNLFVISGYAYAGGGSGKVSGSNVEYKDFYKYDPVVDTWASIPDFPITTHLHFTAFTINSRGYVSYHNQFSPDKLVKYTPKICLSLPGGSSNITN
jgi:hypothetical protein